MKNAKKQFTFSLLFTKLNLLYEIFQTGYCIFQKNMLSLEYPKHSIAILKMYALAILKMYAFFFGIL